jgi:hypothetical protein
MLKTYSYLGLYGWLEKEIQSEYCNCKTIIIPILINVVGMRRNFRMRRRHISNRGVVCIRRCRRRRNAWPSRPHDNERSWTSFSDSWKTAMLWL